MENIFVQLKAGKEASVLRRHPWVFSGAVAKLIGSPQDGDWVGVMDSAGKVLAWGHYHRGNITVRLLHFGSGPLPSWTQRLQAAWDLRAALNLPQTNAFRLVHGEADQCSGLIIDVYGETAVFQAHSIGMHREASAIAAALIQVKGLNIKTIYDKSKASLPADYAAQISGNYLYQQQADKTPAPQAEILENNLRFKVNWEQGQKTGFFLDQRDNRALVGSQVEGKRVLNAFCYSGGFSIYALKGGARSVDSVDASKTAMQLLEDNLIINDLAHAQHRAHVCDVHDFLKQGEELYEAIILDPPAYAKRLDKRHQAVQAYRRLNLAGLRRLASGGMLWTFSCSQVVGLDLFEGAVLAAAIELGRPVRILRRLQQPADHPVGLFHPEGNYLKGLWLQVE